MTRPPFILDVLVRHAGEPEVPAWFYAQVWVHLSERYTMRVMPPWAWGIMTCSSVGVFVIDLWGQGWLMAGMALLLLSVERIGPILRAYSIDAAVEFHAACTHELACLTAHGRMTYEFERRDAGAID